MIQQSFGEHLRQLRRQRGFTQGELGSHQFSKSYVSAVERKKVIPSHTALLHFAEKLQQPIEYFEDILQQSEPPLLPSMTPSLPEEIDPETLSLLDVILKGNQHIPLSLPAQLINYPLFTPELGPWQARQARLLFLHGLMQQEKGELLMARTSFEQALALATADYHPFICNALGTNYALAQDYLNALRYHQRALTILQEEEHADIDLLQQLEYCCGDDYRALGCHDEACRHFEAASRYLRASSNLASAGKLYLGLGYCTYAALFQRSHAVLTSKTLSQEEIERSYQLAVSYLLQSRILYQVSSDVSGEIQARLRQTMVLLDWSFWKYSLLLAGLSQGQQKARLLGGANLLDDAYEQCQQILLTLLDQYGMMAKPPEKVRSMAITSMTYLIRVALRRAIQAKINNYTDTSTKERLLAICLCKWLCTFLESESFSWEIIQRCIHISGNDIDYRTRSIDSLEVIEKAQTALSDDAQMLVEVCFAFGELAEEIALADGASADTPESFQLADQCFQQALISTRFEIPGNDRDTSYALRVYQRLVAIMEQRLQLVPAGSEMLSQMFVIIKEALTNLPGSTILPLIEHTSE